VDHRYVLVAEFFELGKQFQRIEDAHLNFFMNSNPKISGLFSISLVWGVETTYLFIFLSGTILYATELCPALYLLSYPFKLPL